MAGCSGRWLPMRGAEGEVTITGTARVPEGRGAGGQGVGITGCAAAAADSHRDLRSGEGRGCIVAPSWQGAGLG